MPACILIAHNPYAGFPYLLRLNGQIVAGFRQIDLLSTGSLPRRSTGQAILIDGLSYDRMLLRWATNWQTGIWWLRYALFWLRPGRDLILELAHERIVSSHPYQFSGCRVLAIELGGMRPDGAYPIQQMIFRYSAPVGSWKMPEEPEHGRSVHPLLAADSIRSSGGSAAIQGDQDSITLVGISWRELLKGK